MKIHHLRNATFVIESGPNHILVDPMLCEKGRLPPFAYLKHRARRNPLVSLPDNARRILEGTTICLITHSQKWGIESLTHTDHPLEKNRLLSKVFIPGDGETITFSDKSFTGNNI